MIIMFNMNFHRSFISLAIFLLTLASTGYLAAQQDVSHESIAYQGYRIELLFPDSRIEGSSLNSTIINSGKYPVTLGINGEKYEKLQVLVHDNPVFAENPGLKKALISSALRHRISLAPGQLQKNVMLATEYNTSLISPEPEFSTPDNLSLGKPDKKAKKQKKSREPKVKKQKEPKVTKAESEHEVVQYNLPANDGFDTVNCADLVITNAAILKQTKHSLKLECTISNAGKVPAPLHQYKKSDYQDISLAAYFSASAKMSRGSVLAGGHVIKGGLEKTSGLLLPGESITVKFDISLENSSRYLNSLIISVDSRQLLYECIEKNNTFVIQLRD